MASKDNYCDSGNWRSSQVSMPASNSQILMQETCGGSMFDGDLALPGIYTKRGVQAKKPTNKNDKFYKMKKKARNVASAQHSELVERPFKKKTARGQAKLEKPMVLTSKKRARRQTKLEKSLAKQQLKKRDRQDTPDDDQAKNSSIWQPELSQNSLKYKTKVRQPLTLKKPEDSTYESASDIAPPERELNWLEWLSLETVGKPPPLLQDFTTNLSLLYGVPKPELTNTSFARQKPKVNPRLNSDPVPFENLTPQQVLPKAPIPALAVQKKLVTPPVLHIENDLKPKSVQKEIKIGFTPETIQTDNKIHSTEDRFDEISSNLNSDKDLSQYIPENKPPVALNTEPSPLKMHHSPYTNDYSRINQLPRHYEPPRQCRELDPCTSIGNHSVRTPLKEKLSQNFRTKARGSKKHKKKNPKVLLKQKAALNLRKKQPIRKVKGKEPLGRRSMKAVTNPPDRSWISKWIWPSTTDVDNS